MKSIPQTSESSGKQAGNTWWSIALAIALVGLAYWGGLQNGFVWLDQGEILERQLIVDDWDGALSLFSNDRNNAGYQRPAYSLMHSLDWALWGANPRGFLGSSLALHLANVLLVFALLRRLSKSAMSAALIAGIWGLHPVNSAVVGLIHSKADLLFLFGVLAASVCFLRASASGASGLSRSLNWVAAGAAFALALFSKETALLYPLAVTSILLFPKLWLARTDSSPAAQEQPGRAELRQFVGLLWILTFIVLAMRWDSMAAKNYPSELPLLERVLTFGSIYIDYVKKLIVPMHLSICDTVTQFSAQASSVQFRLGTSVVIVLGLQLWAAFKHPWTRRWSLLFNIALLPVSQVIPVLHFRADRFLYLPSLAFVGAIIEGVQRAFEQKLQSGSARRTCGVLVAVVAVLFMGRIALRLSDFRNDETLFKAELSHTPDYLEGLSVLGRTYDRLGHHEPAGELFRLALEEYPGRISYIDRGGVAVGYAYNLLARGELEAARDFLMGCRGMRFSAARALELSYNLSVAQFRLGEYESALAGFQQYDQVNPSDPSCHYFIGRAAMILDQKAMAKEYLSRYLVLAPGARDEDEVRAWLAQLTD